MLHPSGGLTYHLRAWRYRQRLWHGYRTQVAEWLHGWQPDSRQLLLIGPSAGYSLAEDFLAGFARISVLEPDPLARALLRRRFPGIRFDFASRLHHPTRLIEDFPDAAWLFCNLLGQAWTDTPAATWHAELHAALAGRIWASYHDLVSTARPPDSTGRLDLPGLVALDELLGHFWQGGELIVDDHDSYGLFPHLARSYTVWPLYPGRYHLVEWLQG